MRPSARIAILLLCATVLCSTRRSYADLPMLPTQTFNVNTFRPTPGPRDLIIIPQTQPLSHLSVSIGTFFSFIFNPLVLLDNSGKTFSPIADQLQWDVMLAFGLYDWFEFGAVLPVVLFQTGSLQNLGQTASVQATALGDLTLIGKVPLVKRLSYAGGLGAALSLRADLPTGYPKQNSFVSDSTVDWLPSILVDYRFSDGILVGVQVGGYIRTNPPKTAIPNLNLGPQMLGTLGIEVPVIRRYGIGLVGGVTLGVPLSPPPKSIHDCSVNGLAGLRWYSSIGITFTVGAGLDCNFSSNPLSLFLAAVWVPAKTREYEAIERFKKPPNDPDGDGLIGEADWCPNEPGPPENHGCPIRDTDKDGIPDHLDDCPLIPGIAEYHGCPRVYADRNKIRVLEKVYFATDQDTILPESFSVLEEVAALIQVHPEWMQILVEGHCDIRASDAYNLDLSQRRARSVMRFLTAHRVEPSRLRAEGFGRSRPIATNRTEEGMSLNRRVEFTIEKAPPRRRSPLP